MHIFLTPCQHISELTTTTFMQSGNHVVNNKKHVYFFGSNIQIFHRGPGSHFSRALFLHFSIYVATCKAFFWPANNYFSPKKG